MEKKHKTICITSIPSLDTLIRTKLDEHVYVKYGEHVFETNFTLETIEPNKLFLSNLGAIANISDKLYDGNDTNYTDTKKISLDRYNKMLTPSKKTLCLSIKRKIIGKWNYAANICFDDALSRQISSGKRNIITFHDDGASYFLFLDELESAEDFLKKKHRRKIALLEKREQNEALFKATVEPSLDALCEKLGVSRRKNDGALWVNYKSELEAKIKKAIIDTVNNELKDLLDSYGAHIVFNLSSWSLKRKLGRLKFKNILTK